MIAAKPAKFVAIIVLLFVAAVVFYFVKYSSGSHKHGDHHDLSWVYDLAKGFSVSHEQVLTDLRAFTHSPHPFGSDRQRQLADYLMTRIKQSGGEAQIQEFEAETPNRTAFLNQQDASAATELRLKKRGQNVIAWPLWDDQKECSIWLASHYDTKIMDGFAYLGANDSGSSSVLLLQLLGYLVKTKSTWVDKVACNIGFVWFDGEESVLPEWSDGEVKYPEKIMDHTYGSRYFVEQLVACKSGRLCTQLASDQLNEVRALVLFDMIGAPEFVLTRDQNSTPELLERAEEICDNLFDQSCFAKQGKAVDDDHLAFVQKGIKAINLINFEDLTHWHQKTDTIENLSIENIEKTGKVGLALALHLGAVP